MTAEEFNTRYPIGTRCFYWPGTKSEPPHHGFTRSEAWELDCGEPVVKITGYAGGIALEHVEIIVEENLVE